jgi:hypothetical protein
VADKADIEASAEDHGEAAKVATLNVEPHHVLHRKDRRLRGDPRQQRPRHGKRKQAELEQRHVHQTEFDRRSEPLQLKVWLIVMNDGNVPPQLVVEEVLPDKEAGYKVQREQQHDS